jgi:hypothetical protein
VTASSSIVLIASAERLPALTERVAEPGADILKFADSETLQALNAITKGHPHVVALDRTFAETPRGKALINRIGADPALAACRVRIVTSGVESFGEGRPSQVAGTPPAKAAPAAEESARSPRQRVDQRGTRRAPRFKIDGYGTVVVDGKSATLQDLSTFGAQIILTKALKPNQRVQMTLSDDNGVVRFNATIVWAAFEMPPKTEPRYRVGIEFIDADVSAVDAFCKRHRSTLKPEA